MKTIIKHGHKTYSATCHACGCEFTYEICDIETRYDYLGTSITSNPTHTVVTCPCCGKDVNHLTNYYYDNLSTINGNTVGGYCDHAVSTDSAN